ncbi:MAG: hypothetical protein K0R63_785 [Rickettsiales bacterium]|jgi:sec-independent protein translocase protein TatA|nr:hypothetical protein [Rickettsiales bacterium]
MSVLKLLLILTIVFAIFGVGKLPNVMGEMGKGLRNLRDGLKEDPKSNDNDA